MPLPCGITRRGPGRGDSPLGGKPKILTDSSDIIEQSVSSITTSWLEQARHGDNDAWLRLDRSYRRLVCWWCAKAGIPNQDIDDLAQDVFAAVAVALRTFEHQTFRGFLWAVTRNKIGDYWRRRNKLPASWDGSSIERILADVEAESHRQAGPSDQATKIVFDAVVHRVKAEFSEKDWRAFWMNAVEGVPAAEAAATLGVTRNQVYLAKSRILRRIRLEFGDTSFGVPT